MVITTKLIDELIKQHLISELEETANKKGATIYNICHRNAGWAIQWHEKNKQCDSDDFRDGLIIYRYYDTFDEMVNGEIERLSKTN